MINDKFRSGFTLLEILVVIAIIGVLVTISSFGLQGARESARDARRKSDLESIRAAIELYRADCGDYPAALASPLTGDNTPSRCASGNVYMVVVPQDPVFPARNYAYTRTGATGATYEICAALEDADLAAETCIGSCGETCNYKVISP